MFCNMTKGNLRDFEKIVAILVLLDYVLQYDDNELYVTEETVAILVLLDYVLQYLIGAYADTYDLSSQSLFY